MTENEEKTAKFRYFAGVIYKYRKDGSTRYEDESDLARTLRETFGDFAISPLHAPDEENDGEHWHVVYRHPAPCRLEVARRFCKGLFHNDFMLCLHHPRNYQRYLIHLDNPEKEQFPGLSNAITIVNNFPLDLSRDLSMSEKMEIQADIESLAEEFSIFEYAHMCRYLRTQGMTEHYWYFSTHTHHFGKFLDSLRHSSNLKESENND